MLRRTWARLRASLEGSKKFRFLVIGAYNTLFGYFAFAVLYLLFKEQLHYQVVVILAHLLAVANAFLGHKHWVFRSKEPWWPEYLRFNLSYLGSLALGMTSMALLVEWLALHVLVAQGVTLVVTVVISYFLHNRFTFRNQAA